MSKEKTIILVGGCGFIGTNIAMKATENGFNEIILVDNLSRKGSDFNLDMLQKKFGSAVTFYKADTRNQDEIDNIVKRYSGAKALIHLAAQVTATRALIDPRDDFMNNCFGTFNVIDAVRRFSPETHIIASSTNKVYGSMEDIPVKLVKEDFSSENVYPEHKTMKWGFENLEYGIKEDQAIDPHSPYGCSKYCLDSYTHDFGRIYGIPTTVFRKSTIAGIYTNPHSEQQWIASITAQAVLGQTITIFGDGNQARDVLYAGDLANIYYNAINNSNSYGKVYNIGSSKDYILSIWELLSILQNKLNIKLPEIKMDKQREGDQHIYCSDNRLAKKDGIIPEKIKTREEVVTNIYEYIVKNLDHFKELYS